jgi:hypothetical protein
MDELGVEDSVLFPPGHKGKIASIMKNAAKRNPGWKLTLRTMSDGLRIWRVA